MLQNSLLPASRINKICYYEFRKKLPRLSYWQDAVAFATLVYEVIFTLPWFERKGFCDQLQRAVLSISSNIAEGLASPTDADFAHFLDIALGSSYEVESQLLIARNVEYIDDNNHKVLNI